MWSRIVLTAGLLGACTRTGNIVPDFSRHFGCPEDLVTLEYDTRGPASSEHYIAQGCAHQAVFYCDTGDCVSPQIVIARRYSREFDCRVRDVDVDYLDGGAWRATGCGRQVTYQCAQSAEYSLRCFAETSEPDKSEVKATGQ